jgi:hypothetical protein
MQCSALGGPLGGRFRVSLGLGQCGVNRDNSLPAAIAGRAPRSSLGFAQAQKDLCGPGQRSHIEHNGPEPQALLRRIAKGVDRRPRTGVGRKRSGPSSNQPCTRQRDRHAHTKRKERSHATIENYGDHGYSTRRRVRAPLTPAIW